MAQRKNMMDTSGGRTSKGIWRVQGKHGIETFIRDTERIYVPKLEIKPNMWRSYYADGEEVSFSTIETGGSLTVAYGRALQYIRVVKDTAIQYDK